MKRRAFLHGSLRGTAIAIGLPWLEIFHGRKAHASDGFPRRFGLFYWGNGNKTEKWLPATEGENWETTDILSPLQSIRHKVSVVTGMSLKVPNLIPHTSSVVGLVTGQELISLGGDSWTVAAPSIDQLIAREIGNDTIYRSLELGCVAEESYSWYGSNSRNPVETNPYLLYESVFGPTFREPGEAGIVDPRLGYRRSALDAVMENIQSLRPNLTTHDAIRLDQHLEGIRDLELRLARLQEDPPTLAACFRPEAPNSSYPPLNGRPQFSEINAAMSKLIAMTLACDQTRVFTYCYVAPFNNHLFLDAPDGHHNLTHHEPGEQTKVVEITRFIVEQYATLLAELEAIPEGDGSLLDNCVVLGASEVSDGQSHSQEEIPLLLAGGAGGNLRTGIHHRSYTRENVNKMWLSVMRALGINQSSIGSGESYETDSLSGIES